MPRRAEAAASIVNGLIVLLLPFALLAVGKSMGYGGSPYSVTVHPQGWSPVAGALRTLFDVVPVTVPFAVLAACRTWVHAKRARDSGGRGWQGVAEAGACGLGVALLVLLPGIITRPADAAPYVVVYGGCAMLAGLVVGLVLRLTALVMLYRPFAASTQAPVSGASGGSVPGPIR